MGKTAKLMKILCSLFGHKCRNAIYDLDFAYNKKMSDNRRELNQKRAEAWAKGEILYGVPAFPDHKEIQETTYSMCDRCGEEMLSVSFIGC